MATKTADRPSLINGNRVAAIGLQVASYITTLWLTEWILKPTNQTEQIAAFIIAAIAEFILVKMKSALFNATARDDVVGWAGFIIDGAINALGVFEKIRSFLAYPPNAAMILSLITEANREKSAAEQLTVTAVTLLIAVLLAIIVGGLLSVLPHRLWRIKPQDDEEE